MAIIDDIASLSPGVLVELFTLDLTTLGGPVYNFQAAVKVPLTWQGVQYMPYPFTASGFAYNGQGQWPRPQLTAANVAGAISQLCLQYQDLVGTKMTRLRTFVKYLDAVNFPGGVNPKADPTQQFPIEVWYVDQKNSETKDAVSFVLASACDLPGTNLPRRQLVANQCNFIYRSWNSTNATWVIDPYEPCPYAGSAYFDINGNTVTTPEQDVCSHQVASGCKVRFGTASIPFGGFPAANLDAVT